ncbi:MAG: MFS transporter [Candidatus Latescibacteria bacterium]|nr:MFS transporter [Candidatus Latescibacterota bacterium]
MLSRGDINRALRAFTLASGLWGAWGQMVGIGTAVFTGYALSTGADASDIAFFTSVAYLLAPIQLISSVFSHRITNKKRFVVGGGFFEALFRGSLVVIPLVFARSHWSAMFLLLLALGLICGTMYSPFYSSWLATTIPANVRARFTSRQTIVSSLAGMLAGIVAGGFVDRFAEVEKHTRFALVFLGATFLGWAGYAAVSRAPFPRQTEPPGRNNLRGLLQPFTDRNFRHALLFYASWNFAIGLSGPLFSVFMLERLQLSYTAISLLNALSMVTTVIGYQVWGGLIDRFGSKPVLQILLIPSALYPILWALASPGAYVLVSVAMALTGFIISGITIGITPLLYGLLPQDDQNQKVTYLASWSTSVNLIYALGPLLGSLLVRSFKGVEIGVMGFSIGNLQILFLLSAAARVIPTILLRSVVETRAISSWRLLSQIFQGNLLSYAYHNVIYSLATEEGRRARAMFALGKSGNPLALEQLVHALADASPKVRSQAARALGETGAEEAADVLIKELLNGASDIRSEAAEALGRLKHPRAIDPLIEALDDEDPRVRISAIRGLAEIGGEDVQELLFWYFSSSFEPRTFPTLVEALANMEDQRVVKQALQHLDRFSSPAIRLQLLNSVCRALGAEGQFYRLLSQEDDKRYDELGRLLKRTASTLTTTSALDGTTRQDLNRLFRDLIRHYEQNNIVGMMEQGSAIINLIRDGLVVKDQGAYETLSIYLVILAMNTFMTSDACRDLPVAQEIFLTVCLSRIAELLRA